MDRGIERQQSSDAVKREGVVPDDSVKPGIRQPDSGDSPEAGD